jgi:hypothetical protein
MTLFCEFAIQSNISSCVLNDDFIIVVFVLQRGDAVVPTLKAAPSDLNKTALLAATPSSDGPAAPSSPAAAAAASSSSASSASAASASDKPRSTSPLSQTMQLVLAVIVGILMTLPFYVFLLNTHFGRVPL